MGLFTPGAVFGWLIGGWLMDCFDLYHSYAMAFKLNCLVAAAGIVAVFFARMPMPPTVRAMFRRRRCPFPHEPSVVEPSAMPADAMDGKAEYGPEIGSACRTD
jgi:hypothetical protein